MFDCYDTLITPEEVADTGDRVVESGRTLRFTFYFVLNSDDTFNLDHITSNGTELDWLQEMIILNMLNEYYSNAA